MATPVPTLLLRPEGSRDRNGVVTPTLTGGVLEVDGQYGRAWQIAEATTNLVLNPSAETNTTSWLVNLATMTRDTSRAYSGAASVKATWQAATARTSAVRADSASLTIDTTYTASIWVYVPSGQPDVVISVSGVAYGTVTSVKDQWVRLSQTFTATNTTTNDLSVHPNTATVGGEYCYIDAAQIEQKAYATPYADGSLGAGHAWTGTAHASSSTRSDSSITVPRAYVPWGEGELAMRVKMFPASPNAYFLYQYQPNVRYELRYTYTTGVIHSGFGDLTIQETDANALPVSTDAVLNLSFSGGRYKLYVNGVTVEDAPVGPTMPGSENMLIGRGGSGQNGRYESVIFFDRPLTPDERDTLITMPRAWEWDYLFPPDRADVPAYRSQVFLLAPRIYTADRDNRLGSEITRHVTHAAVDADIDRAGPKGQLQIAATDPTVLPANGWIAPFLDVTHEDGTLDSAQMGLYQLDQPELTYDMTGQATASATGVDIVGQLEAWPLGTARTTPVGANVMQAVRDALTGLGLTRHALPVDTRTATTAISHGANVSWLVRINDLLAAIGYHALYATADGRLTSRPLRDARQDTPARTYATGRDSAIVDPVTIRRAAGNLYNVVVAVKEDFQAGTALVAEARNDDPEHPWSTVALGREIAPAQPVTVMEAVDQDALQAIADDKLARASMQETLAMDLLPDATLAVHDVIEITGTDGPEGGRWSVESLAWGLTADSPLVRLGARRTYTTTTPEGA